LDRFNHRVYIGPNHLGINFIFDFMKDFWAYYKPVIHLFGIAILLSFIVIVIKYLIL